MPRCRSDPVTPPGKGEVLGEPAVLLHLCRFKSPPEGGDSSGKVTLPRAF